MAAITGIGSLATQGIASGSNPNDEPIPISPGEETEPYPNLQHVRVSESIKNLTPHWILLVGNKGVTIRYLNNADIGDSQLESYKDTIKEVWSQYPVKKVREEKSTYIVFKKSVSSNEVDAIPELNEVAEAVYQGWEKASGPEEKNSGDITIQWNPIPTHELMSELAALKMGYLSGDASVVGEHADEPDYWGIVNPLYTPYYAFIADQIVHSIEHMYDPSLGGMGRAPSNAAYYVNQAQSYYPSNLSRTYENLGWSTHFIADVGNPLHTGMVLQQIENQWVHGDYENHISANWTSGQNYQSIYDDNYYYYAINDPAQATKDLAGYTNGYSEQLFLEIYNNENTWEGSSTVHSITGNVLAKTALYVRGFAWYAKQ